LPEKTFQAGCLAFLILVAVACFPTTALPTASYSSLAEVRVDVLTPFSPVEGHSRLLLYLGLQNYSGPVEIVDGRWDRRGGWIGVMTPTGLGANGETQYSSEFAVGMISRLKWYPGDVYHFVLLLHFTDTVALDANKTPISVRSHVPDMVAYGASTKDVTPDYGVLVSGEVQYNFAVELRFQIRRSGMSLVLPSLLVLLGFILSAIGYRHASDRNAFFQILVAVFFLALTNLGYVRGQMLQAPFFTLGDGLIFVPVFQIVSLTILWEWLKCRRARW